MEQNTLSLSTRNGLGYAGLIPFIAFALALWWPQSPVFQWALFGLLSYGAIISTFMAGTLWGQALFLPAETRRHLFFASNFCCLLAWAGLLIGAGQPLLAIGMLALSYLLIAEVEWRWIWPWLNATPQPAFENYVQLRIRLTTVVILSFLLSIYPLVMYA